MERLRIEIRTIWPLHGAKCCVELDTLQECPVAKQLRVVDLGPRLDESLLRSRAATADAFDGVEGERRECVLIRAFQRKRSANR